MTGPNLRNKKEREQSAATLREQRHKALRTLPPLRDLTDRQLDYVINTVLHPDTRLDVVVAKAMRDAEWS